MQGARWTVVVVVPATLCSRKEQKYNARAGGDRVARRNADGGAKEGDDQAATAAVPPRILGKLYFADRRPACHVYLCIEESWAWRFQRFQSTAGCLVAQQRRSMPSALENTCYAV